MIDTLPSSFNFLGLQSTHSVLPDKLKPIRKFLRDHYDEEEFLEIARSKFTSLDSLPSLQACPRILTLPKTGGWHLVTELHLLPTEPPEGDWHAYDIETSQVTPDNWAPLCAVATNGRHWKVWLPHPSGQALDKQIPLNCPFLSHNSNFDQSYTKSSQGSLCTMQMASELFAATDQQLHAMKVNGNVPWGKVALPAYCSLEVVAKFCRIPMHSKDTRNLCIENTWQDNYQSHLLEIVNYCAMDTFVLYAVFTKLWPLFKQADPNPLSWLGLLEISKYRLPVEKDFGQWVLNTDEIHRLERDKWAIKIIEAIQLKRNEELKFISAADDVPALELDLAWFWLKYYRKLGKRPAKITKMLKELKSAYSDHLSDIKERLGKICCKIHPYYGDQVLAPEWLFSFSPTPSNNQLPALLGAIYNGVPVSYEYPRFNVPTVDGDLAGSYWGSKVDLANYACEGFDFIGYCEFCRSQSNWHSMRNRLGSLNIINHEWVPQIHKSGTITQRLTDNVLHVAPKHSSKIPGSELMGKFKADPNELFIYADMSGQETMIFQAIADQGVLGSSGYGKTVLTGDMHSVIRDLLGFSSTKEGRTQAKPYTFLLQYGGQAAGCKKRLMADGFEDSRAESKADSLCKGYIGVPKHIAGNTYYEGGLASSGYNALTKMANRPMRTLLLNRLAPAPLQAEYRGKGLDLTVKNWFIQATGTDFLRLIFALASIFASKLEVSLRPAASVHDLLAFLNSIEDLDQGTLIMQASHLVSVSKLYSNLGYKECPLRYATFDTIEVDNRFRLKHLDPYITPSNPGFPVESCPC